MGVMAPQSPITTRQRSKGLHGLSTGLLVLPSVCRSRWKEKPDPHPLPGVPVKADRRLALGGALTIF